MSSCLKDFKKIGPNLVRCERDGGFLEDAVKEAIAYAKTRICMVQFIYLEVIVQVNKDSKKAKIINAWCISNDLIIGP